MEVVDVERVWLQNCRKALFLTASGIFEKYNCVFLFLRCAMVPEGHHANSFLEKSDFCIEAIWCGC